MKLLTLARDLQRRKSRERQALFVCEGVRTVEDLLRSPLSIVGALVSPSLLDAERGVSLRAALDTAAVRVEEVTWRELAAAAGTESPQGVIAVARIPEHRLETLVLTAPARVLVLDAVQDPGNVGTLVRTAAALGADATIATPGTVDLWNAKVVRSAMGALFHHPVVSCTWEELDEFLAQRTLPVWGADTSGEPVRSIAAAPDAVALVVGNEGAGLSSAARVRCTRLVSVPIAAGVESLNVAVAAGIILHSLRP